MIARQPRAFGYTQFVQISEETASPDLKDYRRSIEGLFHDRLEPLGIAWARLAAEPMLGRKCRLRSMPGWRNLFSETERRDHIVVASPEAMASTLTTLSEPSRCVRFWAAACTLLKQDPTTAI